MNQTDLMNHALDVLLNDETYCRECKNSGFVDIATNEDMTLYFYDYFNGDENVFRKCLKIYHDWKKYGTVECLECKEGI